MMKHTNCAILPENECDKDKQDLLYHMHIIIYRHIYTMNIKQLAILKITFPVFVLAGYYIISFPDRKRL